MCAMAGVGSAGSAGGGSAGISAPALARLRHFDSHCARPAARSGGSPRAAAGRACAAGSGGAPPLEPERKATRLGGPLECNSLDWALEGSWRERFRRVFAPQRAAADARCVGCAQAGTQAGTPACGSGCVSFCAWPDAVLRPSLAPRRTRAKDACGDTSAECYVRQRQASKDGLDSCRCCTTKCCSWAAAHVTWLRAGEGDNEMIDASEASFLAALEVRCCFACILPISSRRAHR